MPYTVAASFTKFLENITVSGDQSSTATSRRNAIVDLLSSSFEIMEAFPTGSMVRRTAHQRYADIDVLVALHFSKHLQGKTPKQVLQDVQDALRNYNARIVKKNGQAVTLYFSTGPNVDIVPASWMLDGNGKVSHYQIPDANRGVWIGTQPKTHDEKIAGLNLEGRQLIRMIKGWNHAHSEYMRSFHIETLALGRAGSNDWPWEVYQFFDGAVKSIDSALYHPDTLNGRVDEYLGCFDRQELKTRLTAARDRASSAWYYTREPNKDEKEAIRLYRVIFGDDFPAYG